MRNVQAGLLAICVVVITIATATVSAQPAPYSGIVVFGTSLSDPGNAFALRGGTSTPPDYELNPLLIPDAPYARGGHHFSNGATWIEQFARSRGLAGSARPAFRSASPAASNYAVGGARACDTQGSQNVHLQDQLNAFLGDVGGAAPSDTLYVIEMGANDVRDAIAAALGVLQSGGTFQQAVQTAVPVLVCAQQSIQTAIQTLYGAGAREFLVWTAPDPGLTPAIRSLGSGPMQLATYLTTVFNTEMLVPTLEGLDQTFGDLDLALLDAFALLQQIQARPADHGLTNTTSACVTPNYPPFFCQAADDYLFWDGIHPTRAGHAIVAAEAGRVLAQ